MGDTITDRDIFPVITNGSVLGTYMHGIFDSPGFTKKLLELLYAHKQINISIPDFEGAFVHQDKELNKLADVLRESLDWKMIYETMGL
jgi:adenosylcobyric acid synthase